MLSMTGNAVDGNLTEEKLMVKMLFDELSRIDEIEAIALGGSRAGNNYDEKSDYDVYVYLTSPIPKETRRAILEKYCGVMEIGNHYWEYEDNCTLNDGTDIDLVYRSLDDFSGELSEVVEHFHARNGYTTCMWYNLINCKIIFDRNGRLAQAKKRFNVPYPDKLRENIITRNLNLLCSSMPAYKYQIEKALSRNDRVSVLHRTTAFLESYFDVVFALNKVPHPGEKRLIELCEKNCTILPNDFRKNLNRLFDGLFNDLESTRNNIDAIISELKNVVKDILNGEQSD